VPISVGSELSLFGFIFAVFLSSSASAGGDKASLTIDSEFIWEHPANWFGGLSGVEILADGQTMVIVSDRGRIIEAELLRTNGLLTSVTITHSVALRDETGKILVKPFSDAEGLAVSKDGKIYISFEGQHRVATLDLRTGVTVLMAPFPKANLLADNGGFEALAINPDGAVMAVPEQFPATTFPLFAYRNSEWTIAAEIPKRGPFLPVGADFDENGRFYLLERAVTPLGFRTRVRRFDFNGASPQETTLMQSLPSRFDNLEGISVWQDASGKTHLTLVSDDNFLPIQKTQIVEFSVSD